MTIRSSHSVLHAIVAWLGIGSVMVFLLANIKSLEENVGYFFLIPAGACAAFLLHARCRVFESIVMPRSALFILGFLTYFLLKLLIDVPDLEDIKSFTIGTSEGVIFGYLLGAATAIPLSRVLARNRVWAPDLVCLCLFLCVCVLIAADVLVAQLSMVRQDIFLIASDSLSYQRRGNFAVMVVLIASALLAGTTRHRSSSSHWQSLLFVVCIALYLGLVGILLLVTQIVGSNTGFAMCLLLAAFASIWIWRPALHKLKFRAAMTGVRIGAFDAIRASALRFSVNGVLILAILAAAGAVGLAVSGLSIEQFRIFGFSERIVGGGSLGNRIEILTTTFLTQFAINPVFGNMRAEILAGQQGEYAHSIVSLLSHLGIVGTLLFLAFVFRLTRELRTLSSCQSWFYGHEFSMLRAMVIGAIFAFASIATFFTWVPMWFALGFFFPPVSVRNHFPPVGPNGLCQSATASSSSTARAI